MSKIALITGASSGIGEACAKILAQYNYDLILAARRLEKIETLASELTSAYGIRTQCLKLDVRQAEEVELQLNALPDSWKAIGVLVNNAGLSQGLDPIHEGKLADWDTMIDTNIKGFLYVSQAVSKGMANRKKGHIINIGSTAGRVVYEKGNAYCATKYAVDALNQSMRIDLLRHGIKVTAINPGAAETEFSLVRFKGDQETAASVYNGMKPLTPEDVAEVIYYTTTLPAHVCINDLTLTCLQQADSVYIQRK